MVTDTNTKSLYVELTKKASARTVIVFLRSHMVEPVLKELANNARPGEFMFIGSEAWAKNTEVLQITNNQILGGSFTLVLEISIDTALVDHIKSLRPQTLKENPWIMFYMQEKLGCFFDVSFRKTYPTLCDPDVTSPINVPDFVLSTWATSAYVAMWSLLVGAHRHHQAACGTQSKTLCSGFRNEKGKQLGCITTVKRSIQMFGTFMSKQHSSSVN